MYYDNETTASWPGAGIDYTTHPPISGSFTNTGSTDYNIISSDAEVLNGYYGFNTVYKVSTIGDDVIISGSFNTSSAGNDIHNYWYTGSTENWKFDNDRIHCVDGDSGDKKLTQVSGGLLSNVDLSTIPVSVTNYDQFQINQKYIITFDVVDSYKDGTLTFQFGGKDTPDQGGTSFKEVITVNIVDSGSTKSSTIDFTSNDFQEAPYNYLVISSNAWSGSLDNLTIVESKDTDGRADIFTDVYRAEDIPLGHYNGPFYLSFLVNWPVEPTWENFNASQSIGVGREGNPIPSDAFSGFISQSDSAFSTSSFGHYVYAASQSYWRYPDHEDSQSIKLTEGTANEPTASEILVGSNITGSYDMNTLVGTGTYDGLLVHNNRSVLPSGELYRIYHITSSQDFAPVTSSFLMDVKLFREDTLWSGSISDVVPFSNLYSVSSSAVDNWYSSSLASASLYDEQNINSLWNNLPDYIHENDPENILIKFMSMFGEQFDTLKNYIDNYLNIHSKSYDTYGSVPFNLINVIGENFGWNFVNVNSLKNLLDYYIGENRQFTYEDLTNAIWKNVLNNLIYIYKTKGTENSVRALLNCFGIPPEIISVDEFGGTLQSQTNPTVDFLNSNGINSTVGNISFNEKLKFLQLLNFNKDNNSFTVDWNDESSGLNTGVEFIFSSFTSTNTQTLLRSSGSGNEEMWNLQIVPSGSSDVSASIRFQLNISETGSSVINNTLNITSDPFPINTTKNDKLWNVLLQRESLSNNTGSYKLYLVNRENDTIKHHYSSSLSVTGSFANNNFIGTGSVYSSGSNLIVGQTLTGSVGEIRIWESSLTASKFYMHVFNHNSVAGDSRDDFKKVISRYGFKDKYSNPSTTTIIKDIGSHISGSKDKTLGSSFSSPSFKKISTKSFIFNARSSDFSQYNKKKIIVSKQNKFVSNELSPFETNLESDSYFDDYGRRLRFGGDRIDISISPSKIVEESFENYLSDFYIGDLIGDPVDIDKSTYSNLVILRRNILEQWDGRIDVNFWIRNQLTYMLSNFWESLDQLLPARSYVVNGILIQNDVLFRNKHPRDYETSIGESDQGKHKFGSGINPGYVEDTLTLSDNVNLSNTLLSVTFDDNIELVNNIKLDNSIFIVNKETSLYDFNTDYKLGGEYQISLEDNIQLDNKITVNADIDNSLSDDISLKDNINLDFIKQTLFNTVFSDIERDYSLSDSIFQNIFLSSLKLLDREFISGNIDNIYSNVIELKNIIQLSANFGESEIENIVETIVSPGKQLIFTDNIELLKEAVPVSAVHAISFIDNLDLTAEGVSIDEASLESDHIGELPSLESFIDIDAINQNIFDDLIDLTEVRDVDAELQIVNNNTLELNVETEINPTAEFVEIFGINNLFETITDGTQKSLKQGRISDINDVGHFDLTKFLDPTNSDFKIKNKATSHYTGIDDDTLTPASGSFYETQVVFRTFGDTENINLRGNKRRKVWFLYTHNSIRHQKVVGELWDPTNPDIFTNSVLYKNKPLGRTSFMYIYGHWFSTRVTWGDDINGFTWGDEDDLIHYPKNHYIRTGKTDDNVSIFDMTTNTGNSVGWYDPEGLIDGETEAVIVRTIRGGKKTLKVTNATVN